MIRAELTIAGRHFAEREIDRLDKTIIVPVRVPIQWLDEALTPATVSPIANDIAFARFELAATQGVDADNGSYTRAVYKLRRGPPPGWRWLVHRGRLIAERTAS